MAAPSFTEAALGAGSKIGRYFSIVTLVPSLFLTLWVYALFASDAWRHAPDLPLLGSRLSSWSFAGVTWTILASLLAGMFIHALLFPTVQLLEGYWGSSALAMGAAHARITHYRRKKHQLDQRMQHHIEKLNHTFDDWYGPKEAKKLDEATKSKKKDDFLIGEPGNQAIAHHNAAEAFKKSLKRYPETKRILPTRLGNALRTIEDKAGRQYGLKAIPTAPHFALVAQPAHIAYLDDSQEQFATGVRLCSVSLVATVVTVPAVLTDGPWLLIALIPYTLAYLAYRAALSAADEYMAAVSTVIDLNRFALYERLGLPRPRDTTEERETNQALMALLEYDEEAVLTYARDSTTPSTPRRLLSRRKRKTGP
jgi:hypothetical protein